MNIRRRFGGKKPIICILTLNDGSVVEIPGKGELTIEMISPYRSTIVSAEITKNSTSIGQQAFSSCHNMTSVTIPNSVTSIRNYAFAWCNGLTSVTIPNSVTSIGTYAFCQTGLTSVIIPNSVIQINKAAFSQTGLTSVTIPNTVKSIAGDAFSYCSSLTSITSLATTAPSISPLTFRNIKTGGTLTVPADSTGYDTWMSTDDYYLGYYDWNLDDGRVVAKFNVTDTTNPTQIGYSSYTSSNFSAIEIDGVAQPSVVSAYTFDTLGEHTVKYTLTDPTSIGNSPFRNCSSLTSIDIPDSVTSIGRSAFDGCSSLTSIDIPNNVTSIGDSAFTSCSGITSIDIPSGVTSIGNYAFDSCTNLTRLNSDIDGVFNIPSGVTSIGVSTFFRCTGLTSIVIPDSVTSIGGGAFDYCSGLTSIDIPDGVTSIGNYVLRSCSSLTSCTIGSGVTSIGNYTFFNCSSLTSIVCNATTAPTIQSSTFRNVKTGGTLTVPSGSSGYNVWMGTGDYYLGKYGWTKVEQ